MTDQKNTSDESNDASSEWNGRQPLPNSSKLGEAAWFVGTVTGAIIGWILVGFFPHAGGLRYGAFLFFGAIIGGAIFNYFGNTISKWASKSK